MKQIIFACIVFFIILQCVMHPALAEAKELTPAYAVRPPVHQWIAFQAYRLLQNDTALKNDMSHYLPTHEDSEFYSKDFSTYAWEFNSRGPYCPSSLSCPHALIEGAWEEDNDDYGIASPTCSVLVFFPDDSSCRHFWDPDGEHDNGYAADPYCLTVTDPLCLWKQVTCPETEACGAERNESSLQQAQLWWKEALRAYASLNEKALSYYYLGRVVHLLADLSVPEHAHGDSHIGAPWNELLQLGYPSLLEDYTMKNENYKKIDAASPNTYIPDIHSLPSYPRSTPADYDDDVTKLFYGLTEYADNFDSNKTSGESPEFGMGKFRFARNALAPGKIVERVELWEAAPDVPPKPGQWIRCLTRYVDYDVYNNACEDRIYYYETFYDEIRNTDRGVRVFYTDGSEDFFSRLDEYSSISPWDKAAECIYQPHLQARATGYIAALYQLFWKRTHPAEVLVNGSEGPVEITGSDTLSVIVEYDSSFRTGEKADWWVLADTPFGWYYYLTAGWLPGQVVTYQGPLFDLGPYEVLKISGLSAGTYTFYFGVDMMMNGVIDTDRLYYDSVSVRIVEE